MTKNWLVGTLVVALAATLAPSLSEAKRLGGGKAVGMQRTTPDRSPAQTPPSQAAAPQPGAPTAGVPATAGAAAAVPAAAAAKRSWMGPIAGLAAGLGIAALLSSFGLGEGFANMLMIALLVFAAVFAIRFLISRFGGNAQAGRLATAGAGAASSGSAGSAVPASPAAWKPAQRNAEPAFDPAPAARVQPAAGEVSVTGVPLAPIAGVSAAAHTETAASVNGQAPLVLPEGFDLPAFERIAKMIFIRLQAANDAGDLEDLRQFTTPEMFAATRLELQERGGVLQHTDVERVEAEVVDFSEEPGRHVVSVRFQGMVREEQGAAPTAFDEIWHLVKPEDDSRSWAIAGIQQPK